MTYKPGDEIKVKIGGREFTTVIDPNGTQRLKANGVIRAIQQSFFDSWDEYCKPGLQRSFGNNDREPMGFNKLARMYNKGEFSQEDYLDFYALTGSSMNCIGELSEFEDLEIENPLWEEQK